jgi:hypothetical protein
VRNRASSAAKWRIAQWVVGLGVVGFAARTLARNWDELRAQPVALEVRPFYLLASVALVWAMYALLILAWRVMLTSWGQRLDGWTAARIWTVSSLGKYLPGKVWAIAGMAVMAQQAGVAPWAATGSALVLQALAVGTGAGVVGLTGAVALETAHPGARSALVLLVAASVVGVGLVLWPPFMRRLLALAKISPDASTSAAATPSPAGVSLGIVANVVAWLGYGAALWLLARGLLPETPLALPTAIAVFTASYLAGFLALLAPGGLGVREGLFIVMLQPSLGLGAATVLALASRVLLTLTELGAAAPFLLVSRRTSRVAL